MEINVNCGHILHLQNLLAKLPVNLFGKRFLSAFQVMLLKRHQHLIIKNSNNINSMQHGTKKSIEITRIVFQLLLFFPVFFFIVDVIFIVLQESCRHTSVDSNYSNYMLCSYEINKKNRNINSIQSMLKHITFFAV